MGGEASVCRHAVVAVVCLVAADSHRSGRGLAGVDGAADSHAMVGRPTWAFGSGGKVSIRAGMVAPRCAHPQDSRRLPRHASTATPLLHAGHGGCGHCQYELDPLASGSLVPAACTKSGPGPRPRRHGLADAARRTPRQSVYFRDGDIPRTRRTRLQPDHRVGRSGNWNPCGRLRCSENHRKSFWRCLGFR